MTTKLKKEELVRLYRQMIFIREFEERTAEMYTRGKVGGFCHLYIGEEAVAVGAIAALKPTDYVVAAYRDHGQALARGTDPKKVMAELFGKATGLCKGKGGSMHLFDVERRFLGGDAIVGGDLPVAVGVAFGIKYRGEKDAVLCFFGDGALNQGAFHESLNVASLWKLPVVFLCENNEYGMGTSVARASAVTDLTKRGLGYNIETRQADGMDVLDVCEVTGQAVERAREMSLPSFIEAKTYRFRGHSMSDPDRTYRSKEEVQRVRERDPIVSFGRKLKIEGVLTDEELDKMQQEVAAEVEEAVQFADASPEPTEVELCADVYLHGEEGIQWQ